jgi:hypothetical protein
LHGEKFNRAVLPQPYRECVALPQNDLGTADFPIITAAIAYDDEITAKTYILIIHPQVAQDPVVTQWNCIILLV